MMAERYNGVLTQILRTIANLGCSCNFGKVEVGLALKISLAVRPHLFHSGKKCPAKKKADLGANLIVSTSDPDVRVAALTCYGVLVSNKLSDGEVQKILGHMDVSSQLSNLSLRNSTFPPVIGMCVELSVDSAVPLPVRLESMQLISAMFKAHPILMR